jgi:hypothetical protein
MPYQYSASSTGMISSAGKWISCEEQDGNEDNNGNDKNDAD